MLKNKLPKIRYNQKKSNTKRRRRRRK